MVAFLVHAGWVSPKCGEAFGKCDQRCCLHGELLHGKTVAWDFTMSSAEKLIAWGTLTWENSRLGFYDLIRRKLSVVLLIMMIHIVIIIIIIIICVYMYIYTHIYIHMCYISLYIYIYVHIRGHLSNRTNLLPNPDAVMESYGWRKRICIKRVLPMCVNIYIYIYTYTHIRAGLGGPGFGIHTRHLHCILHFSRLNVGFGF